MIAKRLIQVLIAGLVFLVGAVALLLLSGFVDWMPGLISREIIPVFLLVVLGAPASAAAWLGASLGRRWHLSPILSVSSWSRGFRRLMLAGYLATWVFGVPATISHNGAWAVTEYKRLRASGGGVWDAHPYIQTYLAVPLFPCLILSYHEYQLAGLYGLGTFELSVWYGLGVETAGAFPIWIS